MLNIGHYSIIISLLGMGGVRWNLHHFGNQFKSSTKFNILYQFSRFYISFQVHFRVVISGPHLCRKSTSKASSVLQRFYFFAVTAFDDILMCMSYFLYI